MAANGETEYMEKELYSAAVKGNVELLLLLLLQQTQTSSDDEYFLRKTFEKNNMIHIATRHEQHHFIEESLKRFPNKKEIVCEGNSSGNNPLHVAAEVGNLNIMNMLYNYSSTLELEVDKEKPWRMRNAKGNTPVHVAIMHDNVKVARFLLEKDIYLARIVNHSKEAPLHLAIKHHVNYSETEVIKSKLRQPIGVGGASLAINYAPGENMSSLIDFLVEKESCVTCWPDAQGSTPLHRAAFLSIPYNLQITRSILYYCPQSAEVCDKTGNTVLHLLIDRLPSYQDCKSLVNYKDIYSLRNSQDHDGNTPLHNAAKKKDTYMIRALLESSAKLNIINKEGVSAASLIQQQNLLEMLTKRKMTVEESEAAGRGDLTFLRDRLSKLGAVYFLLSQDSKGRNILHKLMHIGSGSNIIQRDDFVDFIQQISGSSPALIYQQDINGDTPIHFLVRNQPLRQAGISTALLKVFHDSILKFQEEANNKKKEEEANNKKKEEEANNKKKKEEEANNKKKEEEEDANNEKEEEEANNKKEEEEANNKKKEEVNNNEESDSEELKLPWVVQNAQGNTPLHEAIIARNTTCLKSLLTYNTKSAGLLNKCNEAPLHLLARYVTDDLYQKEDVELLVKAKPEAACWLNKDVLTPILIAVQVGNMNVTIYLCEFSPKAAEIRNTKGQNFWHLLANHPSRYIKFRLLQNPVLRKLLTVGDNEKGNTLLHLAIEDNHFELVKDFIEVWKSEPQASTKPQASTEPQASTKPQAPTAPQDSTASKASTAPQDSTAPQTSTANEGQWLVKLLRTPNKAGKTPADLIGESTCLPSDIEKSIWDRDEMIGVRSVWGISTTQMNTYANTIGIIAALLTTITFTTAFTVPGGLIQDVGTPILVGQAAFQVFMVSDIIAMCLSMMVLFCLLWIMATSDRSNSVMILDFSIFLLLGSFFATLLTFMTGLYATTFLVRPWIAIIALVFSSLLILMVHKCIVIRLLIPSGKATLIIYRAIGKYIRNLCTKISSCKRNLQVRANNGHGHSNPLTIV